MEDIKRFYDEVYYADARVQGKAASRHIRNLAERLNIQSDDQVLDVACGTGGWLRHCGDRGAKPAGVDLSSKAIAS